LSVFSFLINPNLAEILILQLSNYSLILVNRLKRNGM